MELFNIAVRCSFCDGGQDADKIGYGGVCSDNVIKNNIKTDKRQICKNENSFCRQYHDGVIDRKSLDEILENNGFICYESRMLKDWKAFAGYAQSGANKGKPIAMNKLDKNALCILTTCYPKTAEDMRCIFAVYLVDDLYSDADRKSGHISANSKYRLCFSDKEAQKLLFWNYYANNTKPDLAKWCMGEYRYFDNIIAAQILKDIAELKKGTNDEKLAFEFLDYFCDIKSIDKNLMPELSGALRR